MNRQIYKMTLSDASDSITFYLLEVPIADDDITGTARNTTIDGNVYEDYLWLKKQWSQKWSIMCKDEYDKLRGIWKRQYTDSEVVSVKYFYGDNIYTDGEVEGSTMQINNDSEVYEGEIRAVKLLGNTTQQTYSGKNLVGLAHSPAQAQSLTYATVSNQTDASVSITAQNAAYACLHLYYNIKAGTYTASTRATSSDSYEPRVAIYKSGLNIVSGINNTTSKTFTLTEDSLLDFRFFASADTASSRTVSFYDFQLEAGSTPTDFEQFVGGIPAPNPDFPQVVNTVSGEQTVKITGKNIFDKDNIPTINNVYVDATGKVSAGSGNRFTYIKLQPNTTYALTQGKKSLNNIRIGLFNDVPALNSQGTLVGSNFTTEPIVATFTTTSTNFYLGWAYANADQLGTRTIPEILASIQLELGNQATTYEPYQGQSYEINLGGNLFDRANATENQIIVWTSGDLLAENKSIVGDYISASERQQFSTNFNACILFYDSSKTYLGSLQTGGTTIAKAGGDIFKTFTIPSGYGVAYMRVEYRTGGNSSLDMTQQNIMLNYGSTALPYAPYTDYAYELAKIGTYQDYIWNDDGTWKIHKAIGKYVMDNPSYTINVDATSATTTRAYIGNILSENSVGSNVQLPMSDYFIGKAVWSGDNVGLYTATKDVVFRAPQATIGTTSASVQTWLSAHTPTIYYALATPTDTEITDAELVGQLEALLAGSLYKGLNNVFLIPSAGADGTMTLDYRIDYEKETVVQDTTPVLLDLTDDGIINACQCRQNVKITMRETVQ